jgi:hypothetical protein
MATSTEEEYQAELDWYSCWDYMPKPVTQKVLMDRRKEFAALAYISFGKDRKDAYADIDAIFGRNFSDVFQPPAKKARKGTLEEQCTLADIARNVIVEHCQQASLVFDRLEFFGKVKDGYKVSITEKRLSEWIKVSERTVRRHIKQLIKAGVIERISGGEKNVMSTYKLYTPLMLENARKIKIAEPDFGSKKWNGILANVV